MSTLVKKIQLRGSKGEKEVEALFDSGASYSCIPPEVAEGLGVVEPLHKKREFGTADRNRKVVAEQTIRLDIHINGFLLSDEFMVIEGLSEEVIIGAATLQKWRIKLDFDKDEVVIDERAKKLRIVKVKKKESAALLSETKSSVRSCKEKFVTKGNIEEDAHPLAEEHSSTRDIASSL